MQKFSEFIKESAEGRSKGSIEIAHTPVEKAINYVSKIDSKLNNEMSSFFEKNYLKAKKLAMGGSTVRKDMPRIRTSNVRLFQKRLRGGYIDINTPFSADTDIKNPFPEGLSGDKAKEFLEAGLAIHDGDKNDDKVDVKSAQIAVGKLKPIQKQIYLSESLDIIRTRGLKKSINYLTNDTTFIVSSDNRIIDGHHRWLAAMLIDPTLKVKVIKIDLPISKLLPLSLAYGDAIGNERNK